MEHEVYVDINCSWCYWNGFLRPGKETGVTEDQRKNQDYPTTGVFKSALILRRVLETWGNLLISVKNYLVKLTWKVCDSSSYCSNNNNNNKSNNHCILMMKVMIFFLLKIYNKTVNISNIPVRYSKWYEKGIRKEMNRQEEEKEQPTIFSVDWMNIKIYKAPALKLESLSFTKHSHNN